jgi:ABC-type branched-subunit amino acid transport system substrate-binding protein
VNDEGGINGRKLHFISYDDAYNLAKTVEQTRRSSKVTAFSLHSARLEIRCSWLFRNT